MESWKKFPQTMYLDPAVDAGLEARAKAEGVGKASLIVAYIEQGLCVRDAVPYDASAAPATTEKRQKTAPRIMRSVYLGDELSGLLSSRASAEGVHASELINRFCVEGLVRPLSGGLILRRTQENFIAEQKAKIACLLQESIEASKRLRNARKEFRAHCPHLRLAEDVSTPRCEDCGAAVTRP